MKSATHYFIKISIILLKKPFHPSLVQLSGTTFSKNTYKKATKDKVDQFRVLLPSASHSNFISERLRQMSRTIAQNKYYLILYISMIKYNCIINCNKRNKVLNCNELNINGNQRNAKPMILVGLEHAHLIASLETRTRGTA